MKQLRLPPDIVFKAYMDLLHEVFCFLRARSCPGGMTSEELFALADALHNVPGLLTNYGEWIDDEKFREAFLRPFDRRWSAKSFSLEEFLDRQISHHADTQREKP